MTMCVAKAMVMTGKWARPHEVLQGSKFRPSSRLFTHAFWSHTVYRT